MGLAPLLKLIAGFYEPLRKSFNRVFGIQPEEQRLLTSVTAGAFTGMIGGEPLATSQRLTDQLVWGHPSSWSKHVYKRILPLFPSVLSTTTRTRSTLLLPS